MFQSTSQGSNWFVLIHDLVKWNVHEGDPFQHVENFLRVSQFLSYSQFRHFLLASFPKILKLNFLEKGPEEMSLTSSSLGFANWVESEEECREVGCSFPSINLLIHLDSGSSFSLILTRYSVSLPT